MRNTPEVEESPALDRNRLSGMHERGRPEWESAPCHLGDPAAAGFLEFKLQLYIFEPGQKNLRVV